MPQLVLECCGEVRVQLVGVCEMNLMVEKRVAVMGNRGSEYIYTHTYTYRYIYVYISMKKYRGMTCFCVDKDAASAAT